MIKTLFVLLLIELCNEKEVIPNAEILIQRNASSYTRNIVCDEGYEAVGYNEQRCTDGGYWTPIFQECRSKSHVKLLCVHLSMLFFYSVFTEICDQISLVSGKVNMLKSPSFLIAVIECDKGFHLEPAVGAVVCSNGQWTPSIPRCVEDE